MGTIFYLLLNGYRGFGTRLINFDLVLISNSDQKEIQRESAENFTESTKRLKIVTAEKKQRTGLDKPNPIKSHRNARTPLVIILRRSRVDGFTEGRQEKGRQK